MAELAAVTALRLNNLTSTSGEAVRLSSDHQKERINAAMITNETDIARCRLHKLVSLATRMTGNIPKASGRAPRTSRTEDLRGNGFGTAFSATRNAAKLTTTPMEYAARTPAISVTSPTTGYPIPTEMVEATEISDIVDGALGGLT